MRKGSGVAVLLVLTLMVSGISSMARAESYVGISRIVSISFTHSAWQYRDFVSLGRVTDTDIHPYILVVHKERTANDDPEIFEREWMGWMTGWLEVYEIIQDPGMLTPQLMLSDVIPGVSNADGTYDYLWDPQPYVYMQHDMTVELADPYELTTPEKAPAQQ